MKGISPDRLRRLLLEGRGQGQGGDYQPWIRANRSSSRGYSYSITGRITGRRHQLLSRLELGYLLLTDRRRDVADIREQFPLLPLDLSNRLAHELGLRPPHPRGGGIHVMTTDFVVDMTDGHRRAIAIKPLAKIAGEKRTREILAIEQAYWNTLEVPFEVVTDEQISEDLIYNLDALHYARSAPGVLDADGIEACMERLRRALSVPGWTSLGRACLDLDGSSGLPRTTHLGVLMHLLWKGDLTFDLRRRLFPLERYVLRDGVLIPLGAYAP